MSTNQATTARHLILSAAATIMLAVAILSPRLIFGQGEDHPRPTNLLVIDKGISHDSLIDVMGKFTNALGVGCDFCHAAKADNPRDMDFASDEKPEKRIARDMMRMTVGINQSYIGKMADLESPRLEVQCITCHRGQPEPEQLEDVLWDAYHSNGMGALDSTYRELRSSNYGGQSFDFRDHVLVHLAFELSEMKPDDAESLLILNREFNPQSALNEWATGKLYLQQGDSTRATVAFKRALEINPNYRRAKRELDALGVK